IAPNCEFMPNAARAQDRGELLVLLPAHVPFAGRKHSSQVVVAPTVGAVRQIIGRIVEVHILAVPAIEEALDVERAAHRYAASDFVRMAKREVGSVISAETAAGNDGARSPVLVPHQRQHVVNDVALVLKMALQAPIRMRALVVPAFAVHSIDAVDLELSS